MRKDALFRVGHLRRSACNLLGVRNKQSEGALRGVVRLRCFCYWKLEFCFLQALCVFCHDKEHQKYVDDIASRRKTLVSTGDRSAKIRTYNYPQGRITDHRINYTIYNLSAFMDGDIQDCLDHLIVAENAERLKEAEL